MTETTEVRKSKYVDMMIELKCADDEGYMVYYVEYSLN